MSHRNPGPSPGRLSAGLLLTLALAAGAAGPATAGAVGAQQVMIQVRVVELARAPLRELGFDWVKSSFQVSARDFADLPDLGRLLDADASSTLANPSAITNTGNPASFEVRGEPGALRDVGLRLDVVPRVTSGRLIELGVELRIEDLGTSSDAPAAPPRTVTTTQRVENGGSLLIGGVLDPPGPWYQQLPVVGNLFTGPPAEPNELVVVVTPWIVDPNRGSSATRVPQQIFRPRPDPDVSASPKVPNPGPKKQPPPAPSYPYGPSDRLQP
ncbi:MAG: hypothetical protein HKP30_06275 [Myxococcales bacterium]|nr:hypothetical protein [Myxococcales bacterium]